MIASFRHKGLSRLYEDDDSSGLPLAMTRGMVQRTGVILADLDSARVIGDMKRPSYRLRSLTGELKGFHAVAVRAHFWIVFRLVNGKVMDAGLMDVRGGEQQWP